MKKWIGPILLFIILVPVVSSQVLRIPAGNWTIGNESSWVGFFGSYLGALVSGVITYFVFWQTIKYYREKDKQETLKQEELKRLSIRPYLTVTPIHTKSNEDDREFEDEDETYHQIYFRRLSENSVMDMRYCKFVMENVGLGTALDINIPFFSGCDKNPDLSNLVCKVGDKQIIIIHAQTREGGRGGTEHCTLTYYDLLGNKYQQYIMIKNSFTDKYGITHMEVGHTLIPELIDD